MFARSLLRLCLALLPRGSGLGMSVPPAECNELGHREGTVVMLLGLKTVLTE